MSLPLARLVSTCFSESNQCLITQQCVGYRLEEMSVTLSQKCPFFALRLSTVDLF